MSKKLMLILSIVELDKGKKLIRTLKEQGVRVHFRSFGFGTAPTEMMDIFGLGSTDKDIVISIGAENSVKDMMSNFSSVFESHSKYGGLMIIFELSAAGRVLTEILNFNNPSQTTEKGSGTMKNEHHNNLIVISVNEGYTDDVMHTAKKAGATGGTVIKGRLADVEQFSEFVSSEVDEDREILLILAPAKTSGQIMTDVNREFGITSPANGIIFAIPTEKAYKI